MKQWLSRQRISCNERQRSPEERLQKRWALQSPSYHPETITQQWCTEGKRTTSANSPGWRAERRRQKLQRLSTREERWTEGKIWGSTEGLPWVFSRVLINKYMSGKHQRSGKDKQKVLEGTASDTHTDLPPATAQGLTTVRAQGRLLRRVLSQ